MGAGPHFKYLWTDKTLSTHIRVSANEYIHMLYNMISQQMDPDKFQVYYSSNNYPKDYQEALPQIYKRLFRVLAHVYHHHLDYFMNKKKEQMLNTTFLQFCYFGEENGLLTPNDEYPLRKFIRELKQFNSSESNSTLQEDPSHEEGPSIPLVSHSSSISAHPDSMQSSSYPSHLDDPSSQQNSFKENNDMSPANDSGSTTPSATPKDTKPILPPKPSKHRSVLPPPLPAKGHTHKKGSAPPLPPKPK